jgi:glycogen operon protein
LGPTLSFKGIDNASYYKLVAEDPRYYWDSTGCGNTLDVSHPRVLQMVLDSLRYWALEMHVDGFRFDLTSSLAREGFSYDPGAAFFDAIRQDPVLSTMKLIAEPWDLGHGGYQVGGCPPGWSEWNGKYRDTVRRFWKGDGGQVPELASRLSGSADLFDHRGRRPWAGINFITAHDGFTLDDLVSHNEKHNEANREGNRDGIAQNDSWNCGVEGPTNDPDVLALRGRQKRNLIASLLLSQGVPMLLAGDEIGNSQGGNNNGYCQDNEVSWISWDNPDQALLAFVRDLIGIRRNHPVFHRPRFFRGQSGDRVPDIVWINPAGREQTDADWAFDAARTLGMLLTGDAGQGGETYFATEAGEPESDRVFLIMVNAHHEEVPFILPPAVTGWERLFDTSGAIGRTVWAAGVAYPMPSRSLALLMQRDG